MRRIGITCTVAILAILLSGCTSASSGSSGSSGSSDSDMSTGGNLPSMVMPDSTASEVPGEAARTEPRSVIVQGSMTLTAPDPLRAAEDAAALVEAAGGRIDSRTEQPAVGDSTASAQLVVRIPADRVTAVLGDIEALGSLAQVSISRADVTEQSRDIDARVTALQASVDRLLGLLSSATDTADLIEIETALSSRQSDLESLQAQRRALSDQVDLATLSLSIGSPETAPVDQPDNFWTGVGAGWDSLTGLLGATLIGLGVALPWLAIAGIVTLAVVMARRAVRRRSAQRPTAEQEPVVEQQPLPAAGRPDLGD